MLLGFSGGGDSHALLRLASQWAGETEADLIPVIIDHGLRPESADEAQLAASRAEAKGWTPRIVRWDGGKPATGLQAAARDFRLRTFARIARESGANAVLLGHTLDDQIETFWRRLRSGGQASALAGMSRCDPLPLWPEGRRIDLIRPLIGMRRAALREMLTEAGEGWIEDPSNQNRDFARVRDRHCLARLEAAGFDPVRLAALLPRFADAAIEASGSAIRWIWQNADYLPWGGVSLMNRKVPVRAMDALRAAVSGTPAQAGKSARRLCQAVQSGVAITAGGVALTYHRGEPLLVRDPGFVSGRADGSQKGADTVRIGTDSIWDGRFLIYGSTVEIRPLASGIPPGEAVSLDDVPAGPARDGLAAIWKDDNFCGIAGLDPCYPNVEWLGPELAERNLFGVEMPGWL